MIRNFNIDEDAKGKRIDKFIAEQLPKYPRAALHKLFDKQLVWLNDQNARPGAKLRLGDALRVDLSPLEVFIEDIELPVIYDDENVMVIDKPAGVISHARGKYFDEPSVASFVRQKSGQSDDRAGIVHRLDRATSGVMITAKNSETLKFLQKQFSEKKTKKKYIAVIEGNLPSEEGVIDMPIGRNPKNPKTFHATELGKAAVTRYKVIKSNGNVSLVELKPETGRTHQLRVHLKQLNHPIIGDELYSGKTSERMMLHAHSLEITLPGGIRKVFISEVPDIIEETYNS